MSTKTKTGLVSISFRKYTPEQVMTATAEAGLEGIEWGSDVHAPVNEIDVLKGIAQRQKQLGLRCAAYGTYFRLGVTPLEQLADYIRAAELLDTDVLRIWCGDRPSCEYSREERERLFELAAAAAQMAERAGVRLCTEFHHHTFTDECLAVEEIIRAADSKAWRTYWQPNQYRTWQENRLTAGLLAPYVENYHVFSWRREDRFPLLAQQREWAEYFDMADKNGPAYALLEFMPDDRIETLPREAEGLRTLLSQTAGT